MSVIVQRIAIKEDSPLKRAIRYYSVMSALNDLHLSPMEIKLLAFIAVKGSISTGGAKEQFCKIFGSTHASIGNVVHRLSKRGLLVEVDRRKKVIPQLVLDFSSDLFLDIKIKDE